MRRAPTLPRLQARPPCPRASALPPAAGASSAAGARDPGQRAVGGTEVENDGQLLCRLASPSAALFRSLFSLSPSLPWPLPPEPPHHPRCGLRNRTRSPPLIASRVLSLISLLSLPAATTRWGLWTPLLRHAVVSPLLVPLTSSSSIERAQHQIILFSRTHIHGRKAAVAAQSRQKELLRASPSPHRGTSERERLHLRNAMIKSHGYSPLLQPSMPSPIDLLCRPASPSAALFRYLFSLSPSFPWPPPPEPPHHPRCGQGIALAPHLSSPPVFSLSVLSSPYPPPPLDGGCGHLCSGTSVVVSPLLIPLTSSSSIERARHQIILFSRTHIHGRKAAVAVQSRKKERSRAYVRAFFFVSLLPLE
nr:unnamed protein product [Digitaria exilis]